jgi:hypothetical protein
MGLSTPPGERQPLRVMLWLGPEACLHRSKLGSAYKCMD